MPDYVATSKRRFLMWKIQPYVGLGILRLSSSREETRAALQYPFALDCKGFNPEIENADSYDVLGVRLDYDQQNLLEFIEAFKPYDPTFAGVRFIGRDVDDVLDDMAALGYDANWDDSSSGCT